MVKRRKSPLANLKNKIQRNRKRRAWRRKCQSYFEKSSVDDRKIIFSCFSGRQYSDSPKAIYEVMLTDPRFETYKFVWAFSRPQDHSDIPALQDARTTIVKTNSPSFLEELYSAKYWVLNYKTTPTYLKHDEQVFVQCWHGTPLKRLGRDIAVEGNAATNLKKIHKSYLDESKKFDYFISPSRYATEKFISSFGLDVLNKEDIVLEVGYPRNDALSHCSLQRVNEIKRSLGIDSDKQVILYCPTFRDNQYRAGVGHTYSLAVNLLRLKEELSDRFVILMRLHYLISNKLDMSQFAGFVFDVSKYDDVNDLYMASDLLITDYSSVFFDYAILRKPVLFYMYDLDLYRSQLRDFYIDLDDLPGEIVCTESDLIDRLKMPDLPSIDAEKYDRFINRFCYLDDGNASRRTIDRIFEHEDC